MSSNLTPPFWSVALRIVGNIITVIGYFVLLHLNPLVGSCLKIFGFSLIIPFCWKAKLYDVIALAGFFMVLDVSNIVRRLII